jgi:acetyl-CoA carboxylase biotin carboxyl carrier protein
MAAAKKSVAKKVAPKKAVAKKAIATETSKTIAKPKATNASSNTPSAVFNIDEINQLLKAVNHSNVNELMLEKGDFKITIRQGGTQVSMAPQIAVTQAPVQAQAPVAPPPVASAPVHAAPIEVPSDNLITIKSPMIGTFYRSSGPGKPLFINVGDDIKVGQVLCIVEAMKLFNEIESEISGKIVKILIDDNSPVEYDQPLFLVQP